MTLLEKTIILIEDRRFLSHSGIDFRAIARAAWVNLKTRRFAQGGSTITQQLARMLFLSNKKTFMRKIIEIGLAFYLEAKYTKMEILQLYIETAKFGKVHGDDLLGFEEACEHYFFGPTNSVDPLQIAALVAMLKSPKLYEAYTDRGNARAAWILNRMYQSKIVEEGTKDA